MNSSYLLNILSSLFEGPLVWNDGILTAVRRNLCHFLSTTWCSLIIFRTMTWNLKWAVMRLIFPLGSFFIILDHVLEDVQILPCLWEWPHDGFTIVSNFRHMIHNPFSSTRYLGIDRCINIFQSWLICRHGLLVESFAVFLIFLSRGDIGWTFEFLIVLTQWHNQFGLYWDPFICSSLPDISKGIILHRVIDRIKYGWLVIRFLGCVRIKLFLILVLFVVSVEVSNADVEKWLDVVEMWCQRVPVF